MKRSEGLKHLNSMLLGTQRLRSIISENDLILPSEKALLDDVDKAHFWQWIWGKKSVIPILAKMLEKPEEVTPLDLYNMMYVAIELEPLIGSVSGIYAEDFPAKVELSWLPTWEPEGDEK